MLGAQSMQKLDDETLPGFTRASGRGLVLFGSHNGKPTLAQARVFTDLWADRHNDLRFGYIDALRNEAAKKHFAVRLFCRRCSSWATDASSPSLRASTITLASRRR
jgi:hypothetical protein